MTENRKRNIRQRILIIALWAAALAAGGAAGWYWMFCRPYCVYEDCRGRRLNMENMRQWEEQMEGGDLGVIRMAGWRTGTKQMVASVSTGRKEMAQVIWVYGSMELADSEGLLLGRFGLAVDEAYCVVSEELARNLFGSVDVAGECIKTEEGKMIVAGVIEKEGENLMAPASEGRVEYLAVEFDRRSGAEGKLKRLLEEY